MRGLLRLAHAIDKLSEAAGKLGILLTALLVLVGFYNVAARFIGRTIGLQLSSNSFIEIQWYTFSVIFFLMFSYNLRHDVNVRVDFLYAKWPPKRKAWVNLLGTVLFLIPFCIMGIWVTVNPVMLSWGRLPDGSFGMWEMSPDPGGLPRAPIKSLIIIAFILLLLQAVAQAIKYLAVLTGHREVLDELDAEAAPPALAK
jgi:TRAP-type mannitol/chloroaromatic compound transport system permease small subunit